ncbi:creatininase family protein [Hyperthermus butylicus]|uniref:Uncharacterized protein, putative amidase n=1 Tax=Hyperthermus butylicus (strain DSM 5456 / JCM 9403 / PLM1-5) TaxID=415426 RepID=A2BKB1_HYPBU|nr:creatininase family protein [Hyperthermus butylicus]ABM80422.1 uncharacterized protein, putative amidase [Hyperthermus butylicus DSM 5456]
MARVCSPYSSNAYCRASVALLPVASVENHGVLPLASDVLIADCVVQRVKTSVEGADGIAILPVIPYSVCVEHEPPRLGVRPSVFIEYLVDLLNEILAYTGSVVIAVFHGGAFHAAYIAARYARRTTGRPVLVYSFWQVVEDTLQKRYGLKPGILHADPVEASILLACGYKGSWLKEENIDTVLSILHSSNHRTPIQPWIAEDVPGLYPDQPVPASQELGETLLEEAVAELISTIKTTAKKPPGG